MLTALQVTTPTDLQIVMTRTFDAPRRMVWDAMTRPDLMKKWMFTPPEWSWAKCEMDLRVGEKFSWEWNGPDGRLALTIRGVYKEIVPHSKIVHTELMEMGPGAGDCGGGGGDSCPEPWELLATLEFTESGGRTTMRMTLDFPSKQARDGALASGMEHGMEAGYTRLDGMLAAGL